MSPAERRKLLHTAGRKCVSYTVTPETVPLPVRWWKAADRLRPLRAGMMMFSLLFAVFGAGCATTRKEHGDCPPALHDKPNTAKESPDGKNFVTLGSIMPPRPFWKRWLNID